MRISTIQLLGFCLLLLSPILSCNSVDESLIEPGISKALAELRKSSISNLNYDLDFNIPQEKHKSISANVKIQFNYTKVGQPLILDFNSDQEDIKSIVVNDLEAAIEFENEHLIINESLLTDQNTIAIEFIAGEQSLNRKDDFLYTLFVPERASTCFPLFDQPDLKANYNLTLSIPEGWEALANGQKASEKKLDGSKEIVFESTKKISSYLFAFAAGEFSRITKMVDGREMTMLHRETDTVKVKRNSEAIFQWHAKSLVWLENYTGQKHPFEHMSFVLIPSFQYGGMEHPGSIFYKASSLLLDESATLNQELGRARLIAHEVSHMWFGNLVTMKWFDDVWLKEVFANFMAAKIVNPEFKEINHDLKFLMSHYPSAYSVDRTMGTHPIKQELDNLKNAGSLYGSIIYQKAPIVMRMLEENIGEEAFRKGIQNYLSTYAYDNADWSDLLAILSENTDYNVKYWNKMWVMNPGMPSIYYRLNEDDEKIKSFRLWSRVPGSDVEGIGWPQKLSIILGTTDSTYTVSGDIGHNFEELEGNHELDFLFTNADGKGYGFFSIGPLSQKHFTENISSQKDVLRASLWINFYELMLREGKNPKTLIDHLIIELPKEQNDLIAQYMLDSIEEIYWRYLDHEQRIAIAPKLEGLLLNMAIGSSENQIQSSYFNTLRNVAISDNGIQLLRSIWGDEMEVEGLTLSENDYIKLAQALALRVEDPDEILDNQLGRIKNPDRKQRFEFVRQSLAKGHDKRKAFFNSLKDPVNRENEEWVIEAMYYLNHPLRAENALEYLKPGLKLLEEIKITGDIFFPKRWLDGLLNGHSSYEADVIIRQFLFSNNSYPKDLKQKILQSADPVFRAVKIRERYNSEEKETEIKS